MGILKLLFFVFGTVIWLRGLWLVFKDHRKPDPKLFKRSLVWLIVGTILESLPWFLNDYRE